MRLSLFLLALCAGPALADPPVIEAVETARVEGGWRFDVTLSHPDTGWNHYADGWRVESPDGEVLGTRELLHPHVEEQPFTRSLSSVAIPEGLEEVVIRARCNTDGWTAQGTTVSLD
ncbi:hypothetical protein [Histidinibacterium aquaticum]|uniref:Uncharacterized protein n=1 Tax=Histidinibacterium aquaticum TaxID=2613962 RepID=A0A5J5GR17_9RHOB|nr:hypothetical protein [Histidinibacterium aquaticum]KAA9010507.1 hypothetical protein F3S47_04485 [Histidinibacterium aquaticum]